jgi:PAS domain S-box-containing protein
MRINQPVTTREYVLRDGAAIISRTDAKGVITDCNEEFIEASGFTRNELIGQPHNLVRHPDMPPEAFGDLWNTLKRGRPWVGIVKNRRKNGDFYWVRASATPLADGSGYSSVRTKPTREEVMAAEALYKRMREDESIRLHEGLARSASPFAALLTPFSKTTISGRLWFMSGLTALLFLAAAALGNHSMQTVSDAANRMGQSKDLIADILPPPLYILEANLVTMDLLNAQGAEQQKLLDKLKNLKADYDTRNHYWQESNLDAALKASLLGEQRKQADLWWEVTLQQFVPAIQRSDREAAIAITHTMDSYYEAHRQGVGTTVKLGTDYSNTAQASLSSAGNQPIRMLIALAVAGSVIALLLAMLIVRHIGRNLRAAGEAASAIASGNLMRPMPQAGEDEIGELIAKMAIMRNSLHELIASVRQNVEILNCSAKDLSRSASDSAKTSEIQSEAATSMAAAVEQMSVSIDHVEENASDARMITRNSAEKSAEGGRIVREAAEEMSRIATAVNSTANTILELEEFSSQISSIAGVIKDIAEQTNLLALNAAIEAARAGEQGRGFAVVADEVRKLAERTANSTQEISGMIDKIQNGTQRAAKEMAAGVIRVNEGVQLTRHAGDSITGIRDGAEQVNRAVDEISDALKEQSSAAREIARRVESIAQGSETNNITAAQTSASAHQLENLALQLHALTTRFRIA